MARVSRSPDRNRLLASLSPADLGLLQPDLEPLTLKLRHVLEKPNKRIEHVYFVDGGIASVIAVQVKERDIKVGLIGCEGMSGTAVVLGDDRSPHSTYIQVAGEGQRIAAVKLRNAMKASGSLHNALLKYVQAFMVQMAHTTIANARAKIDERLARWISDGARQSERRQAAAHTRIPGANVGSEAGGRDGGPAQPCKSWTDRSRKRQDRGARSKGG